MTGPVKFPEAERLADQLAEMLAVRAVEIDATGLDETDAALLQVMLSARQQADRKGQQLTLILPADGPVAELIERLGIGPRFMTPSTATGQSKGQAA